MTVLFTLVACRWIGGFFSLPVGTNRWSKDPGLGFYLFYVYQATNKYDKKMSRLFVGLETTFVHDLLATLNKVRRGVNERVLFVRSHGVLFLPLRLFNRSMKTR